MIETCNPSNSWTIGPKHSNGSCRALKIYHVNINTCVQSEVYSQSMEDLYVILILIGMIPVLQMEWFAKPLTY